MKNWKAVTLALMLLSVMAFSGCGSAPVIGSLPMPPDSPLSPKPLPKQTIIDVYWDATISMQGFTKLAAGNVYRTLPDILGDLGGFLGEVKFFRFGEQVVPVDGRDYRRFNNPDYYTELITSFGNVLDAADPEHLSIVVTDLFESDADWSNVTQKLREKYFSQYLAVAIIGIKNSFSGDIFDVGLNAASFNYDSGDNPERFRPFYLFLMGSEPQIRAFLEQWEAKKVPASEIKYVVFSEYFASYIADSDSTHSPSKNLFEDDKLPKADDRLQEIGVANRNERVELTLYGRCKQLPYTCELDKNQIEHDVRVRTFAWVEDNDELNNNEQQDNKDAGDSSGLFDKIRAWFEGNDEPNDGEQQQEGKEGGNSSESTDKVLSQNEEVDKANGHWQQQENNGAEAFFKWNDLDDQNGNNCMFNLTFSPNDTLPFGQIGLVQVQVVPSQQSVKLPSWISDWDMGNIDIAPEQFDGAKTVNLQHIVTSLKDSLLATAKPTIAELNLVVDGR